MLGKVIRGVKFGTMWTIDEGVSYPYLQWQLGVNKPLPEEYSEGDTGPADTTTIVCKRFQDAGAADSYGLADKIISVHIAKMPFTQPSPQPHNRP